MRKYAISRMRFWRVEPRECGALVFLKSVLFCERARKVPYARVNYPYARV